MTDATKLYKGAAALRKGIAMFAWLGDVEAALKEIPDLDKEIASLQGKRNTLFGEVEDLETRLVELRSEHSGAEAQAEKIISDALARSAVLSAAADAEVAERKDDAEIELAALLETIEKESEEHHKVMIGRLEVRNNVQKQIDELNAELAAIKARL